MNVYVVPEPLKPLTVPFTTPTSADVKPETDSLNLAVTGIGDVFVGLVAVEVSVNVGATVSYVRLS